MFSRKILLILFYVMVLAYNHISYAVGEKHLITKDSFGQPFVNICSIWDTGIDSNANAEDIINAIENQRMHTIFMHSMHPNFFNLVTEVMNYLGRKKARVKLVMVKQNQSFGVEFYQSRTETALNLAAVAPLDENEILIYLDFTDPTCKDDDAEEIVMVNNIFRQTKDNGIAFTMIGIGEITIGPNGAAIHDFLEHNTELNDVFLSYNPGTVHTSPHFDTPTILQILSQNPKIRRLAIDHNGLNNDDVKAINQALPEKNDLRVLRLSNNQDLNQNLDDDCVNAIIDVIQKSPNLTALILSANNIGVRGALAIAHAVRRGKLTTVDLSNHNLPNEDIPTIVDAFLQDNPHITEFILDSKNLFSEENYLILLRCFLRYPYVKRIFSPNQTFPPRIKPLVEQFIKISQLIENLKFRIIAHLGTTFMLGHHPRVGASSLLRELPLDIMRLIANMAKDDVDLTKIYYLIMHGTTELDGLPEFGMDRWQINELRKMYNDLVQKIIPTSQQQYMLVPFLERHLPPFMLQPYRSEREIRDIEEHRFHLEKQQQAIQWALGLMPNDQLKMITLLQYNLEEQRLKFHVLQENVPLAPRLQALDETKQGIIGSLTGRPPYYYETLPPLEEYLRQHQQHLENNAPTASTAAAEETSRKRVPEPLAEESESKKRKIDNSTTLQAPAQSQSADQQNFSQSTPQSSSTQPAPQPSEQQNSGSNTGDSKQASGSQSDSSNVLSLATTDADNKINSDKLAPSNAKTNPVASVGGGSSNPSSANKSYGHYRDEIMELLIPTSKFSNLLHDQERSEYLNDLLAKISQDKNLTPEEKEELLNLLHLLIENTQYEVTQNKGRSDYYDRLFGIANRNSNIPPMKEILSPASRLLSALFSITGASY